MLIYRTTVLRPTDDFLTSYQTSQTEAEQARARLKALGFLNPTTETINFPTGKRDIVAWLNLHAV